ncbi:MAG: translation initiation factor IF-2 subunit gamma [Nanoarchaeota archaeon]
MPKKTMTKRAKTTSKKKTTKTVKKKTAKKNIISESTQKKTTISSQQPVVNIGLVGHVDHGKTTLTEQLSGKWTDTHSEEVKRGITIRLGYADTTIYKDPSLEAPYCYTTKKKHPETGKKTELVRQISFVDAPGHESLMATMLSGSTIMDGAILLVAANETCPQPQTKEHLMALELAGMKNVIVIQNKIDLVTEDRAKRNYKEIRRFLKNTVYADVPILPISAHQGVNIDLLLDAIETYIPTPERDENADPIFQVARSFDINKPGFDPTKLAGGILGGSVIQGKFKEGDRIELRPGRLVEEQNKLVAKPLYTTIKSMKTGGNTVKELYPGGSVAILTGLDPSIVKGDHLTGNVVGYPDKLPPVWYEFKLKTYLLERIVNVGEDFKIDPLKHHEMLMLNVNSAKTVGVVTELGGGIATCALRIPVCAGVGDKVTISRRIGNRFRLIGYGTIQS